MTLCYACEKNEADVGGDVCLECWRRGLPARLDKRVEDLEQEISHLRRSSLEERRVLLDRIHKRESEIRALQELVNTLAEQTMTDRNDRNSEHWKLHTDLQHQVAILQRQVATIEQAIAELRVGEEEKKCRIHDASLLRDDLLRRIEDALYHLRAFREGKSWNYHGRKTVEQVEKILSGKEPEPLP